MIIDATFWVAISFFLFFGLLVYFKIPQKINETLSGLITNIKNEIEDFGDWGDAVFHFDPFRDNLGSKRIGDFLHNLIKGFNAGLEKEQIIEKTIEEYKNQWGKDKVVH